MRKTYLFARLFTGALFVFSGIVKLNDPSGFAIKLNEYFDVFAQDVAVKQDSIHIRITAKKPGFEMDMANLKSVLYSFDTEKVFALSAYLQHDSTSLTHLTLKTSWGGSTVGEVTADIPNFDTSWQIVYTIIAPDQSALLNGFVDFGKTAVTIEESKNVNVAKFAKPNGNLFDFFKSCKEYALYLSIFFCALEVLLGFAMLIGWNMRLTIFITAGLIVFFTFLTGYSAYFNKVTDCGCFGDFLKLKPWHSFFKDLVLIGLISIMIAGMKKNVALFSKEFGNKLMVILSLLTLVFGIFCYLFLPVWDFLPYKVGNDIKQIMTFVPAGQRSNDSVETTWILYKPDGKNPTDSISCSTLEFETMMSKGYQFDADRSRRSKVIIEGYKSPIHDFAINDNETGADMKDSFLNTTQFQFVYVAAFLDQINMAGLDELIELVKWSKGKDVITYALSATSAEPALAFVKEHKLPVKFYSADQKMLMTMARYNPTFYFFKGSRVLGKWSGRAMPTIDEIQSLMSKSNKAVE